MKDKLVKILSGTTLLFIILYIIFSKDKPILYKISNGFFYIGIIYFSIGLITYIRNIGFFKLISYNNYLRRQKRFNSSEAITKSSQDNKDKKRILKLHEYCAEKYKEQWNSSIFYKFSLPLIVISLILAIISI